MSSSQLASIIKDKFKTQGSYIWTRIPSALLINNGAVLANMTPCNTPEYLFEALQCNRSDKDVTTCNKLKADGGYGDWELCLCMIHSDYFENREQCDDFFCNERQPLGAYSSKYDHLERISIDDAFESLYVELTANMDYYMSHMDELAEDLGRPINETYLANATGDELKLLSQELYYKLMCKMLGESPDDEAETAKYAESNPFQTDDEHQVAARGKKQVMLKDYRMLTSDGNSAQATAKRGAYYILFFFDSS